MVVNRKKEVLTSWTKGSYREGRMTIQVEGTARVQIGKLTRRRNVVFLGAKTSCTVIVRCQTAQTCCFRPASCSSLSSCSGLQVPCTYSGQSTLPGVGPKCGIEAVASTLLRSATGTKIFVLGVILEVKERLLGRELP